MESVAATAIENLPPLHVYTNLDALCGYKVKMNNLWRKAAYLVEEPAGWHTVTYRDNLDEEDEDGNSRHDYQSYADSFVFRLWMPITQYYVLIDSMHHSRHAVQWDITAHIERITWTRTPLTSLDQQVTYACMPNLSYDGMPCMGRERHDSLTSFDPEVQVNRAQQLITGIVGTWQHQTANADMHDSQTDHPVWNRLAEHVGRRHWEFDESLVEGLQIWESLGEDVEQVLLPEHPDPDEISTWSELVNALPPVGPRATRLAQSI